MWNQKNKMRNRFLQTQLPSSNVEALNETITIEPVNINKNNLNKFVVNCKNIPPLKSKLFKEVALHSPLGYWRLQSIFKEISSQESNIQMSAMNTLSQILLDKLESQKAISEFDVVTSYFICIVTILTSTKPNLIKQLYELSKTLENRGTSASILKNLSQHPQVVDFFIHETNWYYELCDILKNNFIAFAEPNLLEYFSQFLKIHPKIAIDRGFFELIFHEINKKQANQQILIKCFAFLLNCKEGQKKLENCYGNNILYELLLDDNLETHEFVVQALQSATAGSKISIWRCSEFQNLTTALIRRAHVKNNEFQQLYCLQTLRQITVFNISQKYLQGLNIPQIKSIKCNNEVLKRAKHRLLTWLTTDM